jgi:hypothetical protein
MYCQLQQVLRPSFELSGGRLGCQSSLRQISNAIVKVVEQLERGRLNEMTRAKGDSALRGMHYESMDGEEEQVRV